MSFSKVQTNFCGGEWSPFYQGRSDNPKYKTAMNLCSNGFPLEEGVWVRRPGFRLRGTTLNAIPARAMSVEFLTNQPYDLELSDSLGVGYCRFFRGSNILCTSDGPINVSAISTANPAVLTIATPTTWSSDDQLIFSFPVATPDGFFTLRQQAIQITKIDTQNFTLGAHGFNIDGTNFPGVPPLTTVSRVLRIATPYINGDWGAVRLVQNQDMAILLHKAYAPQILTIIDGSFTNTATATLTPANLFDGPYLDPVTDASKTKSVLNWTGGTLAGPAAYNAAVNVGVGGVCWYLGNYWTYTGKFSQADGSGSSGSTTVGLAAPGSGSYWAEADPTAQGAGATGTINITATFQPWLAATAYVTDDYVTHGSSYHAIANSAGIEPGVTTGWATSWEVVDHGVSVTGPGNSPVGFQASDVGRLIRMFSTPPPYDPTNVYATNGLPVMYDDAAYLSSGRVLGKTTTAGIRPDSNFTPMVWGENSFDQYDNSQTGTPDYYATTATWKPGWVPTTNAVNWMWGRIASVATTHTATVVIDPGSAPMLYPLSNYQLDTWRMGAFSPSTGYPACGKYYESRAWLGGNVPNRFDTSQSGGLTKGSTTIVMSPTDIRGNALTGFFSEGTVTDKCGITYTLNSNDQNDIEWFEPDHAGLLCGTLGGEWLIQASQLSDPITPTSIQAKRVTKYGCANIEPKRTGLGLVFIQKFGHRVMEFLSQVFTGGYSAPHLNEAAKHLSTHGLVELMYQEELAPMLWFRTGLNGLIGALYRRMSAFAQEAPAIIGWHRHSHGGGRTFTSIAVGPTANGKLDQLSTITTDGERAFNEVSTQIFDEDDTMLDAWFLDNALVPDSAYEYVVAGIDGVRFTGLNWLDGKTVTVFALGLDVGDYLVDTNGTVFVPYGSGVVPVAFNYQAAGAGRYMFTKTYAAAIVADNNGGQGYRNGGVNYSERGATVPYLYCSQGAGNYGVLDQIKESNLTIGFAYGSGNSFGPPGTPSIAAPQNMCQTNGYVLSLSPTVHFTINTLNTGAFVYGNDAPSGTVLADNGNAAAASVSGKFFMTSGSTSYNLYKVDTNPATFTFTNLGSIKSLFNADWNVANPTAPIGGLTGMIVDQTDDGVLVHATVNTSNWPQWVVGTTYAAGATVEELDVSANFVGRYISLAAGNLAHQPSLNPTFWRYVPSNILAKFNTTTLSLAWAVGVPAAMNMGDLMAKGQLLNQTFKFLSAPAHAQEPIYVAGTANLVTVNTATGAVTTVAVPGITVNTTAKANAYDSASDSIVFFGSYTSTVSGAPAALNSTVTGSATWYRWFVGANTIQSFVASGVAYTTSGEMVTDWGNGFIFMPTALYAGIVQFNSLTGAQVATKTMDAITGGTGTGWFGGVGTVAPQPGPYTSIGSIPVVIGTPYVSQAQILRPATPDEAGTKAGPAFGKKRRSHQYAALLNNTLGLEVGTDFNHLYPANLKDEDTGLLAAPNTPYSGLWRDNLEDGYSYDSMLAWRIVRPYPASVVSIGAFLKTQD